MAKRVHDCGLLPDAGAMDSPEAMWHTGTVRSVAEYQRVVSSAEEPPMGSRKKIFQPTGDDGPTMTFSTVDGCRLITKQDENAENVCMEGYLQRFLSHACPGICPEVRWIRKPENVDEEPSVTMDAGETFAKDLNGTGLNMIVQIADYLQHLVLHGILFRHGDLHWGNVVRVQKVITRRKRDGNAIQPLGDKWKHADLWYNLRDEYQYQLIDFGMSALVLYRDGEAVTVGVPNDFYKEDVHDIAHDLRCLVTGVWRSLWVSVESKASSCKMTKRSRDKSSHTEWFPWAVDCIVRRAAETNADYALAVDIGAHAELTELLLAMRGTTGAACHVKLHQHPRLYHLYELAPSQWERIWRGKGEVNRIRIAHTLYDEFIGKSTPIFEPANLVAVCSWIKWRHDKAWHMTNGKKTNHVYEYSEFKRFCECNGL